MGILNDFKKLFFAQKSVAKSAARKAGEETKEFAEDSFEKIKDFGEKVADKTVDVYEDVKDYTSDIFDDIMKKKEANTNTSANATSSGNMNTTASNLNTKTTESTTTPTEKKESVVDKAVEMSDKAWEKAEDVSEKVWDKAEDLAGKAKEMAKKVGEKVDEKIDDMLHKAKELDEKIEAERKAIDPNNDGYADKSVSEKLREQGSLLKDKDDFWSKADQYAKGDYSMGKPVVVGKDPAHDDKLDLKPISEIGKGEDLIDDAEIVDDTEPKKPKE